MPVPYAWGQEVPLPADPPAGGGRWLPPGAASNLPRPAKAGIQRRRRIAQHRQYFPPAGAQADDLRQNRFKCAKAARTGKHHRARRFQAGIHQLAPLSLRAVAARSCKITSTVCATSAPAVSGAQRAGRLKACSARRPSSRAAAKSVPPGRLARSRISAPWAGSAAGPPPAPGPVWC